jgi:hypothetical protein
LLDIDQLYKEQSKKYDEDLPNRKKRAAVNEFLKELDFESEQGRKGDYDKA